MTRFSTSPNILVLLILPLLIAASAGCSKPPSLPKLSPGDTILTFGDSLTFGTGTDNQSTYPARLQELTGLTVINGGKPGEISADGAKRLPSLLDEHEPQLLILCHGGNDMLRKKSIAETRYNMNHMIETAKRRGIAVVLLGVPKPKLLLLESADLYLELAKQHQIPIETDIIPEVLGDTDLKSDPIHPNSKGYSLIAAAVHKLLISSRAL